MQLPIDTQKPAQPHHSKKIIRKLARYILMGKMYEVVSYEDKLDLMNYNEALGDVDAQKWCKAMDLKIEPLYSNLV